MKSNMANRRNGNNISNIASTRRIENSSIRQIKGERSSSSFNNRNNRDQSNKNVVIENSGEYLNRLEEQKSNTLNSKDINYQKNIHRSMNMEKNDKNKGRIKEASYYEKSKISKLPPQSIINCDQITFQYKNSKKINLNRLSMNINEGEFHGLIGNNGAGKSTIIKIICGINQKYDGYLFIDKDNPKRNPNLRKGLTYIPDKPIFPKFVSCTKYLYNSAILIRDDKLNVKNEIEVWSKRLEITEIMSKNPNKLSAGQMKKILILKAILERSRILILDEPAANLDIESRGKLFEILRYLNREMRITILISSHILEEIKHYLDSCSIIKEGICNYSGPANQSNLLNLYSRFK